MDILTLNSKVKLGCKICDKCCIYRGDIKLTSINVCRISKYLKITPKEFIQKYTHKLEDEFPEIALNGVGEKRECILYDKSTMRCTVHKVKPMQCVMFPLVPESLKNDFFYNSGMCEYDNQKEIKVKKWLNGNNGIYMKYKDFYIEWIALMEEIQFKSSKISDKNKEKIYKLLFENFDIRKFNLMKQVNRNLREVKELVLAL